MRRLALALLVGSVCGCSAVESERLEATRYDTTGKLVYVGSFYDLRERPSEAVLSRGEDLPAEQREVRIPESEVRSVLANALSSSGLFTAVVNPPSPFAGDGPEAMVHNAQQSSDYLLVGEVNQFHVKSIGFNSYAAMTIPLDVLLGPLSFSAYVASAGNGFFFSGLIVGCWSAEAVLTLSVTLIDTESGKVVHTFRLEERVQSPYDANDAYGTFWDDDDDWIDLGRRLGETALHNAGVRLAARVNDVRATLERRRRATPAGTRRKRP